MEVGALLQVELALEIVTANEAFNGLMSKLICTVNVWKRNA